MTAAVAIAKGARVEVLLRLHDGRRTVEDWYPATALMAPDRGWLCVSFADPRTAQRFGAWRQWVPEGQWRIPQPRGSAIPVPEAQNTGVGPVG